MKMPLVVMVKMAMITNRAINMPYSRMFSRSTLRCSAQKMVGADLLMQSCDMIDMLSLLNSSPDA